MPLFTEAVGTVFAPNFESRSDSYVLKTISINDGKDRDGKTIYTSWNAHFVGKAKEQANNLPEKTTIKFKAVVNKNYNRQSKKEYVYLSIYEFTTDLKSNSKKEYHTEPKQNVQTREVDINVSDMDLPFM